jgi:hypothetical protein
MTTNTSNLDSLISSTQVADLPAVPSVPIVVEKKAAFNQDGFGNHRIVVPVWNVMHHLDDFVKNSSFKYYVPKAKVSSLGDIIGSDVSDVTGIPGTWMQGEKEVKDEALLKLLKDEALIKLLEQHRLYKASMAQVEQSVTDIKAPGQSNAVFIDVPIDPRLQELGATVRCGITNSSTKAGVTTAGSPVVRFEVTTPKSITPPAVMATLGTCLLLTSGTIHTTQDPSGNDYDDDLLDLSELFVLVVQERKGGPPIPVYKGPTVGVKRQEFFDDAGHRCLREEIGLELNPATTKPLQMLAQVYRSRGRPDSETNDVATWLTTHLCHDKDTKFDEKKVQLEQLYGAKWISALEILKDKPTAVSFAAHAPLAVPSAMLKLLVKKAVINLRNQWKMRYGLDVHMFTEEVPDLPLLGMADSSDRLERAKAFAPSAPKMRIVWFASPSMAYYCRP